MTSQATEVLWDYETIVKVQNVVVDVPQEGEKFHMRAVEPHTFLSKKGPVDVDFHYKHGLLIEGGRRILNRHYKKLLPGTKGAVATVTIVEKSNGKRKFTHVDIEGTPGAQPLFEMKIVPNGRYNIIGTSTGIKFKDRATRQEHIPQ